MSTRGESPSSKYERGEHCGTAPEKLLCEAKVPRAILLSGGGNDSAGDELAILLNHATVVHSPHLRPGQNHENNDEYCRKQPGFGQFWDPVQHSAKELLLFLRIGNDVQGTRQCL
ncbi:MAG: hypothetical protein ACR2H4_12810 [Pyrinomonadaceae bacterium]